MKKKILAVVLGLTLCFGMTGCTKGDAYTEVLYDKNTKVMYFVKRSGYQFGITPIYNSDGTVKLYDEE